MAIYNFDRLKVLVIDDNRHMRRLFGTILDALGVKIILEAGDAPTGYELLKHESPDVVFVDWVMKPVNGLQFVKRVRMGEDSPNPFVPIIMVSAHAKIEYVKAARDAGAHEFLAKPVSPEKVYARLASIIEHPRPFVRTKAYFGPDRRRSKAQTYAGPERRAENLVGESAVDLDDMGEQPARSTA